MTYLEGHRILAEDLFSIYAKPEAWKIADMIFEKLAGSDKKEFLLIKEKMMSPLDGQLLEKHKKELLQHRPVQYVLNEAWFQGKKFFVDERVLIPRPETDELVDWIAKEMENGPPTMDNWRVLDIGTGSGCIPVSLKKDFPTAQVIGIDVCSEALYVAAENALTHETDIELLLVDFLNKEEWEKLGIFDIIVSNPPYVPQKDKAAMHPNVLNFEPHKALFVPDNDALIFYEAIAAFGKDHLSPKGVIYVEIHESLGTEVAALFQKNEYLAEVKKDMQGKNRMVKVRL